MISAYVYVSKIENLHKMFSVYNLPLHAIFYYAFQNDALLPLDAKRNKNETNNNSSLVESGDTWYQDNKLYTAWFLLH